MSEPVRRYILRSKMSGRDGVETFDFGPHLDRAIAQYHLRRDYPGFMACAVIAEHTDGKTHNFAVWLKGTGETAVKL